MIMLICGPIHLLVVLMLFSCTTLGYPDIYVTNHVFYPGSNILPQCSSPDGFASVLRVVLLPLAVTTPSYVISVTHAFYIARTARCVEEHPAQLRQSGAARGCASIPTTSKAAWTTSYAAKNPFSWSIAGLRSPVSSTTKPPSGLTSRLPWRFL